MPEEPNTIESRVSQLEHDNKVLVKLIVEQSAVTMALISMVTEILEHEGMDLAVARQHVRSRQLLFQDSLYRKLEDENDRLAAELDTRPTFDFELPDEVRPLFPK